MMVTRFPLLTKSAGRQMTQRKFFFLSMSVWTLGVSLFGFGINLVTAYAENVVCPETIVVEQKLAKPLSPWEAFLEDGSYPLMSISFFDGHPQEKASLVPDSEIKRKGKLISTWQFSRENPRGYWIACVYNRTNVMLTRRLVPTTSKCEVTYNPQITVGGHPSLSEIQCK
jgi:hypothetical protein